MATEVLSERLKNINQNAVIRNSVGKSLPWDVDIEKIKTTHQMFIAGAHKPFVAMGYEYVKAQKDGGNNELGNLLNFRIPKFGDFYNDMVMHLRLTGLSAVNAADKVRYAAFLGHKLCKKVSYTVNNNFMDSYTSEDYNAYYAFKVPEDKRTGWCRSVGQEIPNLGYITPDPTIDEFREYRWIGTGPQTFKRTHNTVDLWIPMLFWFKDVKNSFPSIKVPWGENYISIQLAAANEVVSFADYGGGGAYIEPIIEKCDLYVNNIFVTPEIFDVFINNIGFTLIRTHKRQTKEICNSNGSILLNGIIWPVETLYFNFKPCSNLALSQAWYKNTALTNTQIPSAVVSASTLQINNIQYFEETQTVDTLSIEAHGVQIFQTFPSQFFNSYIPYRFGSSIRTPEDKGWYMMNFNLFPGSNNPSGHINSSRARELYIKYTSSVFNNSNRGMFTVLADTLNFLLIDESSAILKFST